MGVRCEIPTRAGDGIRTHDNNVGNVVLYQLSYTRLLWQTTVCHRPTPDGELESGII